MAIMGGQTAGGAKLRHRPGRGLPFWRTRSLRQERREGAVVLDQFVEEHAIEAVARVRA
jgi:hypothetical protein